MHGELIEFNERLHRALVAKEALVSQMRQELIDLRGPVSAPQPTRQVLAMPSASAHPRSGHQTSVTQVFLLHQFIPDGVSHTGKCRHGMKEVVLHTAPCRVCSLQPLHVHVCWAEETCHAPSTVHVCDLPCGQISSQEAGLVLCLVPMWSAGTR